MVLVGSQWFLVVLVASQWFSVVLTGSRTNFLDTIFLSGHLQLHKKSLITSSYALFIKKSYYVG